MPLPRQSSADHAYSDQIDLEHLHQVQTSTLTPYSSHHALLDKNLNALGIRKRKHAVDKWDVVALACSVVCCVTASISVFNNAVAWSIGLRDQLIVVGFLLSIMNFCLGKVVPLLCLLLEARFGASTIQNYEGLLRGSILSQRLGFVWRVVLLGSMLLPLGLSVAYKTKAYTTGGSSSLALNATQVTGIPPQYGAFNMPTLVGDSLSIWFNTTLQFRTTANQLSNGSEPQLPSQYPSPYGANMLLLGEDSAAMLDLPNNFRILQLQSSLAIGDSLELSADVRGSVATTSSSDDGLGPGGFASACNASDMSTGFGDMTGSEFVQLVATSVTGDNSRIWIAFNQKLNSDCAAMASSATQINIKRRKCRGTWSITRAGIQLSSGSCDSLDLPATEQYVFTDNTFFLTGLFNAVLERDIGDFAENRNHSAWKLPSMAGASAAMLWSCLVGVDGGDRLAGLTEDSFCGQSWGGGNLTMGDVGMLYNSPETIVSIRPTLRRSWTLYLVFVIQPVLMLLAMLGIRQLHSTPLGSGFGMIAILSGIDQSQLEILHGAALSGELQKDVQLCIVPRRGQDGENKVEYQLASAGSGVVRRKLNPKIKYA